MADIRQIIADTLGSREDGEVRVAELVEATGFSRAYIHRKLKEMEDEGKIVKIGKARQSFYVLANQKSVRSAKSKLQSFSTTMDKKGLNEDQVLRQIKQETGIFIDLAENVSALVDFAFTEMLNNAIDHSRSERIQVTLRQDSTSVVFTVRDWGVGIWNNIMNKRNLATELDAIAEVSKGKQTTAPKYHSGQGIFFTRRLADSLLIQSSTKRAFFKKIDGEDEWSASTVKETKGTKVVFSVGLGSKRTTQEIFRQYSGEDYDFDKTEIDIKLFLIGKQDEYVSRSQARRIMTGLETYRRIILDFDGVKSVGQGFVHQIWNVWQENNPDVTLTYKNANEDIDFMIQRTLSGV